MAPEKTEEVLQHIDKAVGKPEDETPEDRQRRAEHVERRARRKAIGVAA
jgi:hypothetical protein